MDFGVVAAPNGQNFVHAHYTGVVEAWGLGFY